MKTNEDTPDKANLKWRLSSKPTREDVVTMLDKGIINKDEARQMLFSEETTSDKVKALEEQVQFLQGVVDKLASQPPQMVYKYIHDYTPRVTWMSTGTPSPYKLVGSSTTAFLANSNTATGTTLTTSSGSYVNN